MPEATRVVSADCHINEPPWVFDGVPERLKDRAPKMMRGADGGDGWSFDGKPPQRTFGIEATAGRALEDRKKSGLTFDDIMPGNYNGTAHIKDMDLDGIWASVVYPANSIFVYVEEDRELAHACMRSYNDWVLDDFQADAPDRIVGLPMVPVDDGMEACLAEVERVLAKGARGIFIPGQPRRPYHDPYYDPLWSALSEAGVSANFHRTFGGASKEEDWDAVTGENISVASTVWRFFSGVRPLTYMAYSGVFERHPGLKIVGAEVNCGWVPFWAQTMDQQFEVRKGLESSLAVNRPPSEYLGENIFVTVLDDHVGFKLMADGFPRLVDAAMYSSDYPHSVTLWPNSKEHIKTLTSGLSEEDRRKVLAGNAERVYGL